jgi:hypothetical protein
MDEKIRLVFIPCLFKSSERTLLFFKRRKWPLVDSGVFLPLRRAFESLGDGSRKEIALHAEPYIQLLGELELNARSANSKTPTNDRNGVIRLNNTRQAAFDWVCPASQWIRFGQLLSGLAGGHQYLTCDEGEDAVVMISDGEYFDDEFKELTAKNVFS